MRPWPRAARPEPLKLTRMVRGDLDWIVMKAQEKDRTRRYETASGLARDLQRYLASEPVLVLTVHSKRLRGVKLRGLRGVKLCFWGLRGVKLCFLFLG